MAKKCLKCGEIKTSSFFHEKKDAKDRLHPYCKVCRAKERKNRYKNNPVSGKESKWGKCDAKYDRWSKFLVKYETIKNNKNILNVKCTYCGKYFVPTNRHAQSRVRCINGEMGLGVECRFYCTDECRKECPTYKQQKHYGGKKNGGSREVPAEFRQMALSDRNYRCEKCGVEKNGLHVHHIEGYTEQPMFRVDLANVIVVCKGCHKKIHTSDGCRYEDYKCNNKQSEVVYG